MVRIGFRHSGLDFRVMVWVGFRVYVSAHG